jgi:RHS repeat-associated protein
LQTLISPAGTFSYTFKGPGNLITNLALPNSSAITNAFDSLARLTGTYLKKSDGTILNSHVYQYNDAYQRTKQTFKDSNYVDYTYDNIGQLKTAVGKESGGVTNRLHEQFGYGYDAAGNLFQRTNNALIQTFTNNNLNELSTVTRSGTLTVAGTTTSTATNVLVNSLTAALYTDKTFAKDGFSLSDGYNSFTAVGKDNSGRQDTHAVAFILPATASYSYDSNGNLTEDGRRTFTYDDENQLVSVVVTNSAATSTKSEFVYDGRMRRRIRKEFKWGGAWIQTEEVRYLYDWNVVIQERDGNNTPTLTLSRGRDLSGGLQRAGGIGGLLARTDHSTFNLQPANGHAFYHADGNGNVTALINTNLAVVAKYLYDSFGNTLSKSGPLADANLYRFSSKENHPNSGLYYYGFRFYDANLQRWINKDPIDEAGGINLYVFSGNDGINQIDMFGLKKLKLSYITTDFGFKDRWWAGFPRRVQNLSEILADIKSKLGDNFDPSGACGDCIQHLTITSHSGLEGYVGFSPAEGASCGQSDFYSPKTGFNSPTGAAAFAELGKYFCTDGRMYLQQCNAGGGDDGTATLGDLSGKSGVPVTAPQVAVRIGWGPKSTKTVYPDGSVVVVGDPSGTFSIKKPPKLFPP